MKNLIKRTLDHCGYICEPTEENLIKCFLGYVDDGVFRNLTYDEAVQDIEDGDITIEQMCYNLLKL